ncbi:hypothetical protein B0H10DRAFT_1948840 [Mycena sp. CBHHK59/15]|nr:hypothetical protein B0H10DRAFT_1948840 [Mycena sp. CBHHK59/15]
MDDIVPEINYGTAVYHIRDTYLQHIFDSFDKLVAAIHCAGNNHSPRRNGDGLHIPMSLPKQGLKELGTLMPGISLFRGYTSRDLNDVVFQTIAAAKEYISAAQKIYTYYLHWVANCIRNSVECGFHSKWNWGAPINMSHTEFLHRASKNAFYGGYESLKRLMSHQVYANEMDFGNHLFSLTAITMLIKFLKYDDLCAEEPSDQFLRMYLMEQGLDMEDLDTSVMSEEDAQELIKKLPSAIFEVTLYACVKGFEHSIFFLLPNGNTKTLKRVLRQAKLALSIPRTYGFANILPYVLLDFGLGVSSKATSTHATTPKGTRSTSNAPPQLSWGTNAHGGRAYAQQTTGSIALLPYRRASSIRAPSAHPAEPRVRPTNPIACTRAHTRTALPCGPRRADRACTAPATRSGRSHHGARSSCVIRGTLHAPRAHAWPFGAPAPAAHHGALYMSARGAQARTAPTGARPGRDATAPPSQPTRRAQASATRSPPPPQFPPIPKQRGAVHAHRGAERPLVGRGGVGLEERGGDDCGEGSARGMRRGGEGGGERVGACRSARTGCGYEGADGEGGGGEVDDGRNDGAETVQGVSRKTDASASATHTSCMLRVSCCRRHDGAHDPRVHSARQRQTPGDTRHMGRECIGSAEMGGRMGRGWAGRIDGAVGTGGGCAGSGEGGVEKKMSRRERTR